MYTYYYHAPRYYRRHRPYWTPEGDLRVLTTRYTYGFFYKPCEGPRGGKARRECARSVYYRDGIFYRAVNVRDEGGRWHNSISPLTGTIWDVHAAQSEEQGVPVVKLDLVDGRPVRVHMDGEAIEIADWGTVASVLLLEDEPAGTRGDLPEEPDAAPLAEAPAEPTRFAPVVEFPDTCGDASEQMALAI